MLNITEDCSRISPDELASRDPECRGTATKIQSYDHRKHNCTYSSIGGKEFHNIITHYIVLHKDVFLTDFIQMRLKNQQ